MKQKESLSLVVDSSIYGVLECRWGKERDSTLTNCKLQPRPAGKKKKKIIHRATEDFVSSGVGKFGVVSVTHLGDHGEVTLEFITTPLLYHVYIDLFQVKSKHSRVSSLNCSLRAVTFPFYCLLFFCGSTLDR